MTQSWISPAPAPPPPPSYISVIPYGTDIHSFSQNQNFSVTFDFAYAVSLSSHLSDFKLYLKIFSSFLSVSIYLSSLAVKFSHLDFCIFYLTLVFTRSFPLRSILCSDSYTLLLSASVSFFLLNFLKKSDTKMLGDFFPPA